MAKDERGGNSIAFVIAMVTLVVLGGAWVYAASDYFQHEGLGGTRGMWENAIQQIPNFPAVVAYVFKNRIWLPIVVIVAEVLVIGFGVFMKKVERDLNSPRRR
jgi:hypothetical protein